MNLLSGIGAGILVLAATVCVALAVFIMLDYNIPTTRNTVSLDNIQPAFIHVPQTPETLQPEILTIVEPTTVFFDDIPSYADFYILPDTPDDIMMIVYDSPAPITVPEPTPSPTPEPQQHRLSARIANMDAFSVLPFYIAENAVFYAEFYAARPDLDIETVVWKVNVSLHIPFYEGIQINDDANPLLISPFFRLPSGFSPSGMIPVNSDTCHLRATPQTVAAFHSLRASAQQAGFNLSITSAYRSAARQHELWVNGGRRDGRIARTYHSEHQTGRALDLWGPGGLLDFNGSSPTGIWVANNAHYHGFIVRYRAETTHITGYIHEPWHITYVGMNISMYMHNNNILSLEEFVGRNPWVTLN